MDSVRVYERGSRDEYASPAADRGDRYREIAGASSLRLSASLVCAGGLTGMTEHYWLSSGRSRAAPSLRPCADDVTCWDGLSCREDIACQYSRHLHVSTMVSGGASSRFVSNNRRRAQDVQKQSYPTKRPGNPSGPHAAQHVRIACDAGFVARHDICESPGELPRQVRRGGPVICSARLADQLRCRPRGGRRHDLFTDG